MPAPLRSLLFTCLLTAYCDFYVPAPLTRVHAFVHQHARYVLEQVVVLHLALFFTDLAKKMSVLCAGVHELCILI